MSGYYREKLSANRLERVYAIAPPRVRQYLDAEIDHVLALVGPNDAVLELGCGYGRVLALLARIVEVDSSSVFCEITAGVPPKKGSAP
jgi:SAM-dependent methyltransferase